MARTGICKYCNEEIEWEQQDDGRWVSFDDADNDERHHCAEFKEFKKANGGQRARTPAARPVAAPTQVSSAQADRLIAVLERIAEALERQNPPSPVLSSLLRVP